MCVAYLIFDTLTRCKLIYNCTGEIKILITSQFLYVILNKPASIGQNLAYAKNFIIYQLIYFQYHTSLGTTKMGQAHAAEKLHH